MTRYAYDAASQRVSRTDGNGVTTQYAYDAAGRLTRITYPTSSVTYAYDANGNRTAMTDPTGATTYAYDALGRVIQVLIPPGPGGVSYQYDQTGNRTLLTYPDGKQLRYQYDGARRLTQLTDWAARVTTYGYDAGGRPSTESRPNAVASAFSYDAASRLTGISQPGGNLAYSLDPVGSVLSRAQGTLTDLHQYDALDRLTRVQYGEGDCQTYSYDAVGNRTALTASPLMPPNPCTGTPTTTPYTHDAADQLVNAGPAPFYFDQNGNQIGKGNDLYVYDAENRLAAIHGQPPGPSGVGSRCGDLDNDGQVTIIDLSLMAGNFLRQRGQPGFNFQADVDWDGSITIIDLSIEAGLFLQPCRGFQGSYTYNGDGLRVSKTENGQTTSYVHDLVTAPYVPAASALWSKHSEDAVVLQDSIGDTYEYGVGNLPILQDTVGAPSWYLLDGLSSTVALTGNAGTVTTTYRYDAFVVLRSITGTPPATLSFAGMLGDVSGLFGAYQPALGRSISGLETEHDVVEYKDGDDIRTMLRPGRERVVRLQAGTMMHELGHSLGLLHGGAPGAPALDDARYRELRDLLISRIPVYTPEWTDLSGTGSGPAMTVGAIDLLVTPSVGSTSTKAPPCLPAQPVQDVNAMVCP